MNWKKKKMNWWSWLQLMNWSIDEVGWIELNEKWIEEKWIEQKNIEIKWIEKKNELKNWWGWLQLMNWRIDEVGCNWWIEELMRLVELNWRIELNEKWIEEQWIEEKKWIEIKWIEKKNELKNWWGWLQELVGNTDDKEGLGESRQK